MKEGIRSEIAMICARNELGRAPAGRTLGKNPRGRMAWKEGRELVLIASCLERIHEVCFVTMVLVVQDQGAIQQVFGRLGPGLERLEFMRNRSQASCKLM